MKTNRIYLDHNATTPMDPRVLDAMLPYFTEVFGNAASIDHDFGHEAKLAVDKSREQIAALVGARPDEIIFTSGATESDNIALFGVAEKYASKGDHIITCVTEHKAVLDCCKRLEELGKKVTYLPVDEYGRIDPESVRKAITPRTVLISIMAANNEIGTIAPLAEIGAVARDAGVLFHTDAAQAAGHVPLDVTAMGIHLMSLSAHKLYGPKGVGALFCRRGNPYVRLAPGMYGGGHERGVRSGTLNVPGIVGFGEAARVARAEMGRDSARFRSWTSNILKRLSEECGGIHLNGAPDERLPNNLNVSVDAVESKALVISLKSVAISAGSACTTAKAEPSHVVVALGYGETRAHNAVRLSVGRMNTDGEIEMATEQIIAAIHQLRRLKTPASG